MGRFGLAGLPENTWDCGGSQFTVGFLCKHPVWRVSVGSAVVSTTRSAPLVRNQNESKQREKTTIVRRLILQREP
jgi:hypothetical protein